MERARAATDSVANSDQKKAAARALRRGGRVTLRVLGAVGGGYILTAALVALLSTTLPLTGLASSDAVVLAAMTGTATYLLVLLWAFSVRSLLRLWAVMAGGTALLMGAIPLLR